MTCENENFGMGLLQSLTQPVLLCGQGGTILFANDAAEVFFGSSAFSLMQSGLELAVGFGSPISALAETVLLRGAPMSEHRIAINAPRMGAERIADVFASPHNRDEDQVILLFQERTMADKMDRQLVSRGAARSVVGLAATLAHEIKNPLAGIRGAAQLLEQSVAKDDLPFARLIRDETDRIVTLLNRVAVFGDDRPLAPQPVNIHAVLERVKMLAKAGMSADITIVENYDPSLPAVFGDQDQLIQVFLNLVKNAAEAIENTKKPTIRLTSAFQPGIRVNLPGTRERLSLPLEIVVEDNGPGVPTELVPTLFDPFVTSKSNGSGLGLALVAKFVADNGGVIDLDNQPGRTRFRVLLPMAPGEGGVT